MESNNNQLLFSGMSRSDNNIVSDYEDLEIVVGQADVTSSLIFWDVSSSLMFGDAASSLIFGDGKSESSLTLGEHDPPWYLRRGSTEVFGDWNPPQAIRALEPSKIMWIWILSDIYIGIGPEQETKKMLKSILKNWEMSWVWPLLHTKADALFRNMLWQL